MKVEGLIIYSIDQEIFKFKATPGLKDHLKTINPDELTNLELWGVNVDFKSYDKKWTIHGVNQNMCFYPPTANPCVMMRENLIPSFCEYIAVCQDDLYIASPTPEDCVNTLKTKYRLNINADYHLGAKYPNDPYGTMICQLKKYLEELHEKFTKLFTDNPPKDLEIYIKIIKILTTNGNPTLMPKEVAGEYLNDLSRKRKGMGATTYTTSNRILPIVVSIVSCSPLSSCYKLKILLLS